MRRPATRSTGPPATSQRPHDSPSTRDARPTGHQAHRHQAQGPAPGPPAHQVRPGIPPGRLVPGRGPGPRSGETGARSRPTGQAQARPGPGAASHQVAAQAQAATGNRKGRPGGRPPPVSGGRAYRMKGAPMVQAMAPGIRACIPGRKQRKTPVKYDKRRNRIEIMFGRLKDWRRVATRYDRCPKVLLFAVALAATVIFWL